MIHNTQSAQLSQEQDGRNGLYSSSSLACWALFGSMIPALCNCKSGVQGRGTIVVITRRAHCFHCLHTSINVFPHTYNIYIYHEQKVTSVTFQHFTNLLWTNIIILIIILVKINISDYYKFTSYFISNLINLWFIYWLFYKLIYIYIYIYVYIYIYKF